MRIKSKLILKMNTNTIIILAFNKNILRCEQNKL
jgi:hypothetical protein